MKKLGLVLEGGGAKCAYQNGVLAVLEAAGYKFDGIAGTSYGAVNGALYLEGKSKRLDEFWSNLSGGKMFNDDKFDEILNDFYHKNNLVSFDKINFFKSGLHDTSKLLNSLTDGYRKVIYDNVNEDAIRKNKCEFYLVTCKMTQTKNLILEGLKKILNPLSIVIDMFKPDYPGRFYQNMQMTPIEISKDEIKKGLIADYVIASASNPPFKPMEIDGDKYFDGGAYANCPYETLKKKGYKDLVIIRTNVGEIVDEELNLQVIAPKESLGSCALFATDNIKDLRRRGLMDGIEFVDKIKGDNFFWKLKKKKLLELYK